MAATAAAHDRLFETVCKVWRKRGYGESTIRGYWAWVARHRAWCTETGRDPIEALTRKDTLDLARKYAVELGVEERRAFVPAQSALRACANALAAIGTQVPSWAPPRSLGPFAEVVGFWREQGYRGGTIRQHLGWMRRHLEHHGAIRPDLLTRQESLRFARAYMRKHRLGTSAIRRAQSAFRTWSQALAALGTDVPPWVPPRAPDEFATLLADYRTFRNTLRGLKDSSLDLECRHARAFLRSLRRRRRLSHITLREVDRFFQNKGQQVAASTLASFCTSLRSFLRFLHATGRVPRALADDVEGPRISRTSQPPRGLPWSDVRRILDAIDRSTLAGKRDYAAFLLMATYGIGAAEIRGLRIDDIDWQEGTIRIVRGKTGVTTILPLLGPVGEAMASYLRACPPRPPSVRTVFLRAVAPPRSLSALHLRNRFRLHARAAGISAAVNTHAFRHSHATRQVESAAPPRVVSDILGHADPSSLSIYARVAVDRLREVCLPVPG